MPTQRTIYSNCNPELLRIFEQARHPAKVLCVALDYAKAQHMALFCNGVGDLLKSAFAVDNTTAGAERLLQEMGACVRRKKIDWKHVFCGGEDQPAFAENFLRRLRQERLLVVRVNAWEAKQQRENFQASSDALDLLGIARCCLNRRAQSVQDWPAPYTNLRLATRDRDKVVRLRTLISNRIHSQVDRLFPGFLQAPHSGLEAFSRASLDLMEERFSPEQLSRRPRQALAQWLGRRGVQDPPAVAQKLKQLAKETLHPAPEQTLMLQQIVTQLVKLYRDLDASIGMFDRQTAYWLARTPGAVLTSIGGIGVTLAAGWTAELGPPNQWRAVRRLCSYAGVVSRTKQTGGPSKEPVAGTVQKRCNKRFKNVVLQAVEKVKEFGPEELRQSVQELDARGAHTNFAMAKRLVRLCKCLAVTGTLYRPKLLLDPQTSPATLAAHYQATWEKLLSKWRDKADLNDVFRPELPLGQWRNMARELYALELRLPRQRSAAGSSAPTP
jgi:transposase